MYGSFISVQKYISVSKIKKVKFQATTEMEIKNEVNKRKHEAEFQSVPAQLIVLFLKAAFSNYKIISVSQSSEYTEEVDIDGKSEQIAIKNSGNAWILGE